MIVVTGSQGFIGGNIVRELRFQGHKVVGVDNEDEVPIGYFSEWWSDHKGEVEAVIHMGAITDTMETDEELLGFMNVYFTKIVWFSCFVDKVPLIYASSAATYGSGEHGFIDDHCLIPKLHPLNAYANSKQVIDEFTVSTTVCPPQWYGLKFFNVYGCGEDKKQKMASMIHQGYCQIKGTGRIKLFKHGHHRRDFVHVKDVMHVIFWLLDNKPTSGIYNVGTGISRTFEEMAKILFKEMKVPEYIEYIDFPKELALQYQDFTQADISKLRSAGYDKEFFTLEEGIKDFVNETNHLTIQPKAKR